MCTGLSQSDLVPLVAVPELVRRPAEVIQLDATMSLPSRDIAPIKLQIRRLGPGHYVAPGVDLPISGDWQLEVSALLTQTDEVRTTGTIPIK